VVDGMEALVEESGMKSVMDTVEIYLYNTNHWRGGATRENRRVV
jgi:hypothetical protein